MGLSGVNIAEVVELRSRPELPGVVWYGLLSLFSKTFWQKMFYLASRETFCICKVLFITNIFLFFFPVFLPFSFFFFLLGEAPPEGILCKEQALF